MGRNGFTVLVLLYLVGLVATIVRIGKTLAQDRVAHISHKLAIHGVGHFMFVHPETLYRDVTDGHRLAPQTVLLLNTHLHMSTLNHGHTVRGGLVESTPTDTRHLTAFRRSQFRTETARKHDGNTYATYDTDDFLHISINA